MPCYECENGKWKFGETGRCQYSTKSECETANKDYYAEETYNDYPQAATNNAKATITITNALPKIFCSLSFASGIRNLLTKSLDQIF